MFNFVHNAEKYTQRGTALRRNDNSNTKIYSHVTQDRRHRHYIRTKTQLVGTILFKTIIIKVY